MATKETTGQVILKVRKALQWTQDDLAAKVGTSKQVISRYERDERSPKISDAEKIANALGITLSQLQGQEPILPAGIQKMSAVSLHHIPMIGEVAAGVPIIADQVHSVYIDSPCKADYALTVKGDSMNPTYQDGDIIYIHEQPTLDYDGQVAVIILEDCATVKHVWRQPNGVMLTSDNPAYPSMFYAFDDLDSIRILGKVCGFTRMYKP